MPIRRDVFIEATRRGQVQTQALIRDLRNARSNAGLSQATVARAIGVSRALMSAWEVGHRVPTPIQLYQWGSVVGLDISVRAFAVGSALRDAGQLRILDRFKRAIGDVWEWRTEVPVTADPRDRRSFDAVLRRDGRRVAVEAIGRLIDAQGQVRPIVLKQEASGVERVVLVLADTRHNRTTLIAARPTLEPAFPCSSRPALATLRVGELPFANAVVVV